MMDRRTRLAARGEYGFDCNTVVSVANAQVFAGRGYTFAVRYLPRVKQGINDLTATEVVTLHGAGISVMPVQHVQSETMWEPTSDKGDAYGSVAAQRAVACGFLPGCTVWLDLEGVAEWTPAELVVEFCRRWYANVRAAGFEPGVYVGWRCGLSASDLYYKLSFTRYWGAYNLNADESPVKRGLCMKQGLMNSPAGIHYGIDSDVIRADALGGLPTLLAP